MGRIKPKDKIDKDTLSQMNVSYKGIVLKRATIEILDRTRKDMGIKSIERMVVEMKKYLTYEEMSPRLGVSVFTLHKIVKAFGMES